MANCLVIGGNGFLGSHIVDELVALGHEVTVFDRFSTPEKVYTAQDVRVEAGDFLDHSALRKALVGQELVFHFLSTSTPASAESDPTLDIRTNVAHSVALFSLAVEAGVTRVYFASTGGAIYGEQSSERISELALAAPVSPYAIGKQAIEGYLRYFQRKHGLESVSFRISNPYGPRQHPSKKQGVIPIFLNRIAAGQPLEVFGDASMVRDYIFAPDAARMIARTVSATPQHEVYNIGSGVGATLSEVIELVRNVTNRAVELDSLPAPSTFVQRSVLDIERYATEFGATSFVSLDEGIASTWQALMERQE